ncbi:MAG: TlpA family protein disulfide reductase [Armatimonadetes bacterium]|nr:TlpA family protein disulfide reductase [Armatimonadota bacterium]
MVRFRKSWIGLGAALVLVAIGCVDPEQDHRPAEVAAATTQQVSKGKIQIGGDAPALKVSKWIKGEPVNGFQKGQTYVVELWATWCPPCREWIPHITKLAKAHPEVTFIGVSILEKDQKDVRPFVEQMGAKMDYHVAIDLQSSPTEVVGYMAKNWLGECGQDGIPYSFIIDKNGKVAWMGFPWELESALMSVLSKP